MSIAHQYKDYLHSQFTQIFIIIPVIIQATAYLATQKKKKKKWELAKELSSNFLGIQDWVILVQDNQCISVLISANTRVWYVTDNIR